MNLDRIIKRWRKADDDLIEEARKAVARTEQIVERVESQWPEVHRHNHFSKVTIRENHLSPKIRAAIANHRGS